jgi:hypothetical protein
MKPGRFTHIIAVLLSSITSLFTHSAPAKVPTAKMKVNKKSDRLQDEAFPSVEKTTSFLPAQKEKPSRQAERFPWKKEIVTTIFWIGEEPTPRNPVPNRASSWDQHWTQSYGGYDNPEPSQRSGYVPARFTPRQNPFYCALPYNDKAAIGHRPEAARVVPWFNEVYQGPAVSTCKGRWVAIRKGNRVAYAQWEDAGPFRTDHWQYVFGNERPKPNLNKGAGLDVSPAVRDFLGLNSTDVTDWRFVDFSEVPQGPWAKHGDNNTFVINQRRGMKASVQTVATDDSTVAR